MINFEQGTDNSSFILKAKHKTIFSLREAIIEKKKKV